jgi:hypothetical protein
MLHHEVDDFVESLNLLHATHTPLPRLSRDGAADLDDICCHFRFVYENDEVLMNLTKKVLILFRTLIRLHR